ncbi:hypothetical protein FSP39_015446 [Pinctada imbricata]|uniref:Band 7 domain-containing protein n=1 Tax=Pinctada imbricata TaxID=66713 RepID=A0AA89BZ81_PINIB|nr:hypothetical protein FSP39_015446 [Pinctada imbricata]
MSRKVDCVGVIAFLDHKIDTTTHLYGTFLDQITLLLTSENKSKANFLHFDNHVDLPDISNYTGCHYTGTVELSDKKRGSYSIMGKENMEVERGGDIGCCGYILWFFSILLVIMFFPFSLCMAIKVVTEYERAVIFRLGRVTGGAKGPGLFFLYPCIDEMKKVDLRTVAFDVPPQEILSKDSVTVAVDAVVYFRIFDPIMSVCNVDDAFRSAQLLAATTLRNVLGTKNMAELLSDRDHIASSMQQLLDDATDPWGIKVERVEIKDVRLPIQLQRAMAAEAEATREARAKVVAAEGEQKASRALKEAADVIMESPAAMQLRYLQTLNMVVAAEGEQKASRALKEAADVIMESPAAMQLRYLQTLNMVAAEKNSTIIFPLPIDMMAAFMKK